MGTATPQPQPPQQQAAAAEPRSAPPAIIPTPTAHEIDTLILQVASGTQPWLPWHHAMDGSAIDMQSPDPTAKTTTWP
jgi:hypothetical protein